MSPRTPIITLNLGSQTIELAVFHILPPGGMILENYRARDLPFDSAKEDSRLTQTTAALREMLCELRINSGLVNYTVAEELIFTRFIELPTVEPEKVERIVSFEAQQNVPFPIEELTWDYQQVCRTAAGSTQVILAAIKSDLIEEINRAVEAAGLRTSIVDLATMALYHAFCHSYPELTGCSLLIDIGARTTNLLFIEPSRIFTRSIPLGGSSVTAAIAKEFNETFEAAEIRKKSTSTSLRSDDARVSTILHNMVARLQTELQRSISHYCSQQNGQPPDRFFLSGGGASIACIRELLCAELNLPTELFNPLRKVGLAESTRNENIVEAAHLLGEPVGLALRSLTDCAIRLNLCPASVLSRKDLEKRQPVLVVAMFCVIVAIFTWAIYYAVGAALLRHKTEVIQEKVNRLRTFELQLEQVRDRISTVDGQVKPLIDLVEARSFWPEIIEELNERLPKENIWITELVATSGGKRMDQVDSKTAGPASPVHPEKPAGTARIDGLLVRGLYLFNPKQQEVAVDFFRNLTESPWFSLNPNHQAKALKPTTPNDFEWAFPYELDLELRKPIPSL